LRPKAPDMALSQRSCISIPHVLLKIVHSLS
jgi:hypothetical protein